MAKRNLYWRLFRGLLANPRYFYFIWRREAHTQTAARLARQDVPPPGTFYPVKLDLRIVYACNLRCKMCAQWGETGTYFVYGTPKLQQKLDLHVIERVVRELAPHGLRYVHRQKPTAGCRGASRGWCGSWCPTGCGMWTWRGAKPFCTRRLLTSSGC